MKFIKGATNGYHRLGAVDFWERGMGMKNTKIWLALIWAVLIAQLHVGHGISTAEAQDRLIPNRSYYTGFNDLYEGDYKSAVRMFRSEYRTAYQFGKKRYLDSVCALTMLGECNYRVGEYQTALQMYNEALTLYQGLESQGWQQRIQMPRTILPDTSAVQQARITWGTSQRPGRIANVPDVIPVMRGRLDASIVFETQQGGVFDPAELRQVNVTEILRCVALAVNRRREIMGTTGRYDPVTIQMLTSLKKSSLGNGTLMGAYNGIVYGMVLSAVGEHDKAAQVLNASLKFNGDMDHGLTALGLAELAHIGIQKNKPDIALNFALEASYSAAIFEQPDVIERAFELATQAHLMSRRTALPALVPAIAWSKREQTRVLETALNIRLAECLAEAGDAAGSNRVLATASKLMSNRNNISQTLMAGRVRYLQAVNQFSVGDYRSGQNSLKAAMQELSVKLPASYRLRLADDLVQNGSVTEKQSDLLYSALLQDPSDLLWRTEPMEAMAFLLTPHGGALERWFEILINRKQIDRAVGLADQIRRHRFYEALPLGGRLLSLRWVMQGDTKLLDSTALQQRQELLTRHSEYRNLFNQTKLLNVKLEGLQPDTKPEDLKTQRQTLQELEKIHSRQESILASMALRREPANMAFPPQGDPAAIETKITDGQIIFNVLQTKAGYHIFFFDSQRARYFGLVDANEMKKGVGKMLAAMGVAANYADQQLLAKDDWKEAVREFQRNLFEDFSPGQLETTKELVVIPDGLLWYVPFEAFLVGDGPSEQALIERTKVRYCPTLFLALATPTSTGEINSTGVVTGPMYPKTDSTLADKAFTDSLEKTIQAKKLNGASDISPNQLVSQLDQLVVISGDTAGRGLGMQPLSGDSRSRSAKDDAALSDWMKIPLSAPDHIVMMGLNSIGGEGGLPRPDGSELFFTATSAMASGARSVVLSRWNTGGQMQVELAARYARSAVTMPVTTAMQDAIKQIGAMEVDVTKEPRLKEDPQPVKLTGVAPFFWASPMLVSYNDQRVVDPAVLANPVVPANPPANPIANPGDMPANDPVANDADPVEVADGGATDGDGNGWAAA